MERGRIVKALSGFYYVDSGNGTLTQCRARGRFRKERMSPLVGDWVRFSGSGAQGMVEEIEPRRNSFIRPAVSNLDALVVLASGANPVTDPFLIDRVAAIAGNQNVPVVLCVNKTDLESGESLTHIYRHAGFPVFPTSAASGEGVDAAASYAELSAALRRAYGSPAEAEEREDCRWEQWPLGKLTLLHSLWDRFGPEEHLHVSFSAPKR